MHAIKKTIIRFMIHVPLILLLCCEESATAPVNGPGAHDGQNNAPGSGANNGDTDVDTDSDSDTDSDMDSDTDGDGDGDVEESIMDNNVDGGVCVKKCDTASDCMPDNALEGGIFDLDNWECTSGGYCRYLGCLDTEECKTTYPNKHVDGFICHTGMCFVYECSFNFECTGFQKQQTNDSDNWTCDPAEGVCAWTGCNNNEECKADYAGSKEVCYPVANSGISICAKACSVDSDCIAADAGPLNDENNMKCRDNSVCVTTGCRNDLECIKTGSGDFCADISR